MAWASCATVCAECEPVFCEPCDPTLRALQPSESEEYVWDGQIYLAGDDLECDWEGTALPCLERVDAPAGRYAFEICHSPEFVIVEERFGSCHGTEGYVSPATLDSPSCETVEIDYDPCEEGFLEVVMPDP